MSTSEPLNAQDRQGPVYYESYELQLQECQRLLRLPDKNLGRIYRLELERAVKVLEKDVSCGKC